MAARMMELEEGSGTQDSDAQLLENCHLVELEDQLRYADLISIGVSPDNSF